MKKVVAFLLACLLGLCGTALASDNIYIANPNSADRLHLRKEPSSSSQSLGKYYNGAPIVQMGMIEDGWMRVQIGNLTGYMSTRYLSRKVQKSAMPLYLSSGGTAGYEQADTRSASIKIPKMAYAELMGVNETTGWCHLRVFPANAPSFFCFLPQSSLSRLERVGIESDVSVYVANPNKKDRLHLREAPDRNARSLGKYYNGCEAKLISFEKDGKWVQVELYGRTGWMSRDFVCVEGMRNPTYYGIPEVRTTCVTYPFGQALPAGTSVEVLGLVNTTTLHIRINGKTGFISRSDTDFEDAR